MNTRKLSNKEVKIMASKLSDRSISKIDVETLFRDVLSLEQIEQMGNLLKLLGLYVFVDRKQLDAFAELHYRKKIGLSTLQKAVKYNLIAELQSQDDFNRFFFQLKSGGYYYLEAIRFQYRLLPLSAAIVERERLLAINDNLVLKKHKLTNAPYLFEPLITTDNLILLNKKSAEDEDIKQILVEHPYLRAEKMYLTTVHISAQSRGNQDSMLQA